MRRARGGVAVVVALVLLGACGSSAGINSGLQSRTSQRGSPSSTPRGPAHHPKKSHRVPSTTTTSTAPTTSTPTAGGGLNHSRRLVRGLPASALGKRGLVAIPWKLVRVEPGGRIVDVRMTLHGCGPTLLGDFVKETRTEAIIYLLGRPSARTGACPMYVANVVLRVRLTRPLGNRKVVHPPGCTTKAVCRLS